MDSARVAYTTSLRAVAANTARLAVAQTTLQATRDYLKTAKADLKADPEDADQHVLTDNARNAMKAARDAADEAQGFLDASEIEAAKAKQVMNQAIAARSRRVNRHDMIEPALPADEAPVVESLTGEAYVNAAKAAFADLEDLETFPEPTGTLCSKPACQKRGHFCPCNLKAAFSSLSAKELKSAKGVFNPAQFAGYPDFQTKAEWVCQGISKSIEHASVTAQSYHQGRKAFNNNRRMNRGI